MKVTANEPGSSGRRVRIWLDDTEVTNDCFEADDVAGYVMVYQKHPDGKVKRHPTEPIPLSERKLGRVRIEIHPVYKSV